MTAAMGSDVLTIAMDRVHLLVDTDARAAALDRLERAYTYLATGGRLDVVADDLRWTLHRLTAVVDQQLATAERVLTRDIAA